MTVVASNLLVKQLKQTASIVLTGIRLFVRVKAITASPCGHTFAYGIDLNTSEIIKIRLNTVDEGVDDLMQARQMSQELALKQVKSQYTGANSRDSLQTKRDKYQAAYLSFDRCIEIPSTEFGIKAYRSHWAELMSADPAAEVMFGLGHVHRQLSDPVLQNQKPGAAWTEIVETIDVLVPQQQHSNHQSLMAALSPMDEQHRPREGYVALQVYEQDQLQSEIRIFQHRKAVTHPDPQGQALSVLQAVSAEETLEYYFNGLVTKTNTEFNISRDIARIILNIFCGHPVSASQFSSQATDYLASLRQLYRRFKDQQLTVRLIAVRTILFGPYKIRSLLASNPQKGPLKLYQNNQFLPTILVIQRHADSGRAFGVFALPAEQASSFKPCTLSALPIDMAQYTYRHLIAKE